MHASTIEDHYQDAELRSRFHAALQQRGLGDGPIPRERIEDLDQLHTRGLEATRELAAALHPRPGSTLLDVGCGTGGTARFLSGTYGCIVTGIDLTPAYIDIAQELIKRTGQTESITFLHGDALDLSFASETFDAAWTQHVAMNIHDRDRLYAGIHRVLKPGGRFAIHDIIAGNGEDLRFPVPWSPRPDLNHLLPEEKMRTALAGVGFHELTWLDRTDETITWIEAMNARRAAATAPVLAGPSLLQGPGIMPAFDNLEWNLKDGRVRVIMAIVERD